MKRIELKWGCIIGVAGLLWLYLSYFLGWHTDGIARIQMMVGLSLVVSLVTYLFALRAVVKNEPETTFLEGLKSGAIMAVISALIAMLAQVGYFFWINPGWTEYMVEQTGVYYEGLGAPPEDIEALVEQARVSFSFRSYLVQSGVGALVTGFILSALIMMVIRLLKRR